MKQNTSFGKVVRGMLRIGSPRGAMRRLTSSAVGLAALLGAAGAAQAAAQALEYRKLLDFGINGLPASPRGGVVVKNAVVFGVTTSSVYRISAAGGYMTYKTLHTFDAAHGNAPSGELVMDARGFLYGATSKGGAHNDGVVYKLGPVGGGYEVLHDFTGGVGTGPDGLLALDTAGNVYGLAGTMVFKIAPDHAETLFKGSIGDGPGGVIRDAAGNLYGTTSYGGSPQCGNVFKVAPDGTETTLHDFGGFDDGCNPSDLIMDGAGNLYGTTYSAGSTGGGTVFKISPGNAFQVLYTFSGGSDGSNPFGGLALDAAGNLYGTTSLGGSGPCGGCGVVFELTPAGQESVLHNFNGNQDGAFPFGNLFLTAEGTLYGVTEGGGLGQKGIIYALKLDGPTPFLSRASAGR